MNLDFIDSEWIKRYCDSEIKTETERWEKYGRPQNDGYINGSHSGHTHALEHLKELIEMLGRVETKQKHEDKNG
jgi:hypothetical protein